MIHRAREHDQVSCPRARIAGVLAALGVLISLLSLPSAARADEGGVSYWVPGFFGSLAAAPLQPGWSVASIYYHTSVDAGGKVAFARQVTRGDLKANFRGNLRAVLDADADLGLMVPTYTFASPVLGGQMTLGAVGAYGRSGTSVDATLTGALGPIGFTVSGGTSDTATGFADPAPFAQLRWNSGVHNLLYQLAVSVPVGDYEARRLSTLGIGHAALDNAFGYTYFDQKTGNEFSAVLGFTYNFENFDTDYQNGVNLHLDWAASKFLTKQWQVGLVGYAYQQLTADTGQRNRLGGFESRVFAVGPQVGYVFQIDERTQGYLNLKGYWEFEADNRPEGWNTWLTFSISPAARSAGK